MFLHSPYIIVVAISYRVYTYIYTERERECHIPHTRRARSNYSDPQVNFVILEFQLLDFMDKNSDSDLRTFEAVRLGLKL